MLPTQQQCKYIFPVLLCAIAFIRIPVPDNQMRYLFQLLTEMAVIVCLGTYFFFYISKILGLFLFLVLFSSMHPVFDKASYMARNTVMFHYVWMLLIVWMIEKKDINVILNSFCLIAIFNSIFVIMQYKGLDPYRIFSFGLFQSKVDSKLYAGFMTNPNELSALLAMCFPAFLRSPWIFLIPLIIAGLVIANSTGGVMALSGGLIFYILIKSKGMRLKHLYPLSSSLWFSLGRFCTSITLMLSRKGLLIKQGYQLGK